jgi:hypothetical protein
MSKLQFVREDCSFRCEFFDAEREQRLIEKLIEQGYQVVKA